MARNIALFSRKELTAQRRFVTGVTASVPQYRVADAGGNKEWTVDVYIGPLEVIDSDRTNVIKSVPIAPYARQLIGDIRQPVLLERSKQGKYAVIGRAKTLVGGTQLPEGSIFEPTYHEVKHNLADLRIRYIADLDFVLEELQDDPGTELQADPAEPLQVIGITDSFGKPVVGDPLNQPAPVVITTTRHIRIVPAKLGPKGDPLAMNFGTSELQPFFQELVELTV